MIKFKKIRWKNFLSTGKTFSEIQLDKTHTTLLLGESGAGKSTLLDAITFSLFNKPFRNISKPNLVNSVNGKNCVCEIEFDIGKKSYKIVRGIKPNIFEIWRDGNLVNKDASSRDYQQFLEKEVLKFNIKSFKQIVVLGAAGFTPFMQLRPQDRRIIIEELLDIEVFSVMNNLLKQRMSSIKSSIDDTNFNIQLLHEKIKLHQQYLNDLEVNKDQKITDNLQKIEVNKKQIESLQTNNEQLKTQISELEESISFKRDVEDKISKINESIRISERDKGELSKHIAFLHDSSQCPTCEQSIDEEFAKKHIAEKTKSITELDSLLVDVRSTLQIQKDKLAEADVIQDQIMKLEREINQNKNSMVGIQQYIKKVAKETLDLKKKKPSKENQQEQMKLETEITNFEKNKESLTVKKAVCDFASDILKDSGVKARIIKQYLPLINKYTNKFLTHMDFFVTFTIDEEFNEAIKSRGRDDFGYESFSEGEKQRIDLALLFTWRAIARMKNSINTNLLIMDEVFDSYLDMNATENVIQLLATPMFAHANIFVISHKDTIADKFEEVIRFKKKKNFSVIE